MTDNTARLAIIEKIANLRARAKDAGSSETEMVAAMKHAEKLMNGYRIEEAEIALAETEGKIVIDIVTKTTNGLHKDFNKYKPHRHKFVLSFVGIEMFTDTKCVMSAHRDEISWTGHRPDVEMAEYLAAVIRHAMDSEWITYARSNPQRGRGAKAAFETAMATRICNRLQIMAGERNKEQRRKASEDFKRIESGEIASSTALVIAEAREQKIRERDAAFRARYPKLGSARGFGAISNGTAFSAGRAAGDRVNLGRAVGGGAPKAMIGR